MKKAPNYYKLWSIFIVVSHVTLFLLSIKKLLLFNEVTKSANFVIAVLNKVKSIDSPRPQLQEIVVEALFAYTNHGGSVLERVPLQLFLSFSIRIWHHYAIIQLSPYTYFLDDFADRAFLGPDDFILWLVSATRLLVDCRGNSAHPDLHQSLLFEVLYLAELGFHFDRLLGPVGQKRW